MTNEIVFVGAGPGSPDLITLAGCRALNEADLIIYAGSLVNPEILKHGKKGAEIVDSAPLTLGEITDKMVNGYKKGQKVIRLHTGDPSIYGAIHEQIQILKTENVPYRVIPGVTAATAGAAALGLEFTLPEITQTLMITRIEGRTPMPDGESLAELASHHSSLALYLSAAQGPEVSRILSEAYGAEAPVALCYQVTWPDERIIWTTAGKLAETLIAEKLDRHTLILVGPAVAALKNNNEVPKSRLYSSDFSHGYRGATSA